MLQISLKGQIIPSLKHWEKSLPSPLFKPLSLKFLLCECFNDIISVTISSTAVAQCTSYIKDDGRQQVNQVSRAKATKKVESQDCSTDVPANISLRLDGASFLNPTNIEFRALLHLLDPKAKNSQQARLNPVTRKDQG